MSKELELEDLEKITGGASISPYAADNHCILGEKLGSIYETEAHIGEEIYIKNSAGTDMAGTLLSSKEQGSDCASTRYVRVNIKYPSTAPGETDIPLDPNTMTVYLVKEYY